MGRVSRSSSSAELLWGLRAVGVLCVERLLGTVGVLALLLWVQSLMSLSVRVT